MEGPPFAVADREVRALLEGDWALQMLEGNAWFLQRGLSRLEEHVYRLSRSSAASGG